MSTCITNNLAAWIQNTKRSALQDMLELTSGPEYISFGLGLPNPSFFPNQYLAQASVEVLSNQKSLQYSSPSENLKEQIQKLMNQRGVNCKTSQIFLTAGAQQGINLLVRLLLEPDKVIITEEVTYTGFLQVLEPFQSRIVTVPTDSLTGIDVEKVEKLLEEGLRPACIYIIPNGHNPLSYTLTQEKRMKLGKLAEQYEVPIIEDDPYGFIKYEDSEIPPIKAFQSDWVFYVGSFSKILAPGLRLGWIIVNEDLIDRLSIVKEATDINTANLNQQIAANFLQKDDFYSHLSNLCFEYKSRRDCMLQSLSSELSTIGKWIKPESGLFIWVELPEFIDTMSLFKESIISEKVTFFPGNVFSVNGYRKANSSMRLNFSYNDHEIIREGIYRLARLVRKKI